MMSQPGWQHHPPETTLRRIKIVKDEQQRTHVTKSHDSQIIHPNKFSSLKRFVHVTGWVQRFLINYWLPMNLRRKDQTLLPTEISEEQTFWIKQAQAQAFPGGENERSLIQLNPKSDRDGLLQREGCLRFTDELPYNTRHPILLPKDHPVPRLVIVDAHEGLHHGARVEQVLTELRGCFWIVKGRHMVWSVTEACAECRRWFTMKMGNHMMAHYPGRDYSLHWGHLKEFVSIMGVHSWRNKDMVGQEPSVTCVFSLAFQSHLCIWKCPTN